MTEDQRDDLEELLQEVTSTLGAGIALGLFFGGIGILIAKEIGSLLWAWAFG